MSKLLKVIESEPTFDKSSLAYLGRTDKFIKALAKEKRFVQLSRELNWDKADMDMVESPFSIGYPSMNLITRYTGRGRSCTG